MHLGNPVAVVTLETGMNVSTSAMQNFARWTNLSETTFLCPPTKSEADYLLRIFTPSRELPFAGHPTLGSCHAWLESGGIPKDKNFIIQECAKGLIKLRRTAEGMLSFEAPPLNRDGPLSTVDLHTVTRALRLNASDIVAHSWCDNGPHWMGVLLKSSDKVLQIDPDYSILGDWDLGIIGPNLHKTSNGDDFDFEVRAFCGGSLEGKEDPVTGSLNASLA